MLNICWIYVHVRLTMAINRLSTSEMCIGGLTVVNNGENNGWWIIG